MNELIQALLLQSKNPNTGMVEEEKFAELIVKKCAELAEECYCGDTVKWMLLTRFGVEP